MPFLNLDPWADSAQSYPQYWGLTPSTWQWDLPFSDFPIHTRGWWVRPFIPRCPKGPLFPSCCFNWWAELFTAAFSERTNKRIDVKLCHLPRCTWPYGRILMTQNCAYLFTDLELCKGALGPLFGGSGEPTALCLGWWSCQMTCLQRNKRCLYYHIL